MSMASIKSEWDAVVVGAGPAGLAAATLLANRGVDVLLLDEQPEPGGQIYRGVERNASAGSAVRAVFGDDYFHGAELVRAFRASSAVYAPGANVWRVTQDRKIYASDGAASMAFQARCIILATGAIERPVAIPGWTLPGVMTAGALQILLKTSGLVPTAPTVIAGTGAAVLSPGAAVTCGWREHCCLAGYAAARNDFQCVSIPSSSAHGARGRPIC